MTLFYEAFKNVTIWKKQNEMTSLSGES